MSVKKDTNTRTFDITSECVLLTSALVTPMTKEQVLTNACRLCGSKLVGCAVGEESYTNGKKHVHIWIRTSTKVKWNMKQLDSIANKHGHYLPVREHLGKALAYTVKDNNYVYHGRPSFREYLREQVYLHTKNLATELGFLGGFNDVHTTLAGRIIPMNLKAEKKATQVKALIHASENS